MSGLGVARALDLVGVFAFALSGASLAARKDFDVVGLVVLALATSLGGGVIRDVLVGGGPPTALLDQTLLGIPFLASALVFLAQSSVERLTAAVLAFDAAGLGLFAVAGAATATEAGLGNVAAVLVGAISAVGGGVIRDVLARDVPVVFLTDSALYAIPAALGAALAVGAVRLGWYGAPVAFAIAGLVLALRLFALRFGWRAPSSWPRRW